MNWLLLGLIVVAAIILILLFPGGAQAVSYENFENVHGIYESSMEGPREKYNIVIFDEPHFSDRVLTGRVTHSDAPSPTGPWKVMETGTYQLTTFDPKNGLARGHFLEDGGGSTPFAIHSRDPAMSKIDIRMWLTGYPAPFIILLTRTGRQIT